MEIKIGKHAHVCTASGRTFEHEEAIHSLVRLVDGELVREDYGAAEWRADLARGAYSVWTATYCDPKVAEQEPPEVFSPLRQLFYESVESEDRIELAKAYLAAQLLRRQKVFRRIKETGEGDGDVRVLLYADRIGNRLIEVRDPSFSYAEMEEARGTLLERLMELETPQPDETSPEDASEENIDSKAV